jgi:hypothetical protein
MGHGKSTGDQSRNNLASSTSKGNISGAAKLSRGDLHSKGDLHGASLADGSPQAKSKGDHHGKHKPKSVGGHSRHAHQNHSHHDKALLESIKHKQKHERPLTAAEIEFMSTRVIKGKHFRFKSRPQITASQGAYTEKRPSLGDYIGKTYKRIGLVIL